MVVPASTLANWKNEFERLCPSFEVVTFHGNQRERLELRADVQDTPDIVLTTYSLFEREALKDDRKFLYGISFDYLVLDEAHCIKNAETSRYSKLNGLRTSHRLLLSGTPVQNDVSELLALLSFLMPQTFSKTHCSILLEAFSWDKLRDRRSNADQNSLKKLRSILG